MLTNAGKVTLEMNLSQLQCHHDFRRYAKGFQQERTVYLLSVSNLTVADFLFYVNRCCINYHIMYKPLDTCTLET